MKLRIKDILKSQHISQKELADRMGVKSETITRILAGGNPTMHTLASIAKALNVNIGDLFDNEIDGKNINGFIEIDNVIHKVTSKDDLDKIYKLLKK